LILLELFKDLIVLHFQAIEAKVKINRGNFKLCYSNHQSNIQFCFFLTQNNI